MGRPVVAKNVALDFDVPGVRTVSSDDEFVAQAIAWGASPPRLGPPRRCRAGTSSHARSTTASRTQMVVLIRWRNGRSTGS